MGSSLSSAYSRKKFINFIGQIIPILEIDEHISVSRNNNINTINKIAVINLDKKIFLFEVEHQSKNDPRIELTKNFFSLLSQYSIDSALVVFHCRDSKKYRFSLVESYLTWKDENRVKREFSNPKRLSYLLGEDAKIHTPHNQFKQKVKNFKDLKNRFNKEIVTEEFFENYKRLFFDLKYYLDSDDEFKQFAKKNKLDISLFAKKLLGQIVFCYFLQKKRWLGAKKNTSLDSGDENFLRNKFIEITKNKKNFFNDLLEPLFYLGLSYENSNSFCAEINCKVPYLNGGLFEPIENYDWEDEDLKIPNSIFSNENNSGILDIFDLYNFTVDENEDLDLDIAIDPEMLGNVFEKLLDLKTREQQGTYYTPKEVAIYMCRASLKNYLLKNHNNLDEESVDSLFSGYDFHKLSKSDLSELDNLLKNVAICDPCIGSGAFAVTMMNEVSKLRSAINKDNQNLEDKIYFYKKYFIQNNIYGVDIEPGAVEISKLRLWLSLIVDIKKISSIDTLPNLDYKIMQGDSLIDEYHGIKFEKSEYDLIGIDPKLENSIKDLQTKQSEYLNLKYAKSKFEKRKQVQEKLKDILMYVLNQKKNNTKNDKNSEIAIKNIEKNINEISYSYAVKDFFFWKLFFSDIFNLKKGFDIVIANPPYVFTRDVDWENDYKKFIINRYLNFSENMSSTRVQTNKINLYIVFLVLSLKLINNSGVSCFIIPNTVLRSVIHKSFRNYLINNSSIKEIVDLKPNTFKGVTASPIIFLCDNLYKEDHNIKVIDSNFALDEKVSTKKHHFISQKNLKNNSYFVFDIFSKEKDSFVINKIKTNSILLKNISKYIIEGIVAKKSLIHSSKKNKSYREIILGGNIKRFQINFNSEYLEYTRAKIHRPRPDELWRADKKILIQRISGGLMPLVCAIDENKYLSFASTNILLLHEDFKDKYSYELISVIINSKLINYFYRKSFSNDSKLTVNVSTTYLEEIPIPLLNNQNKKIIQEIEKYYFQNISNQSFDLNYLDDLVFKLYDLDQSHIDVVISSDSSS